MDAAIHLIERLRRKRVGVLGLSFKAGTDDLRESPILRVVGALVGKGFSLLLHDPHIDMERVLGANRRFVEDEVPYLPERLRADLREVVAGSEIVVVANPSAPYREVGAMLQPGPDRSSTWCTRSIPRPSSTGNTMASRGRVLHLSENLTLPFDRRVWMELNALRDAGYEVSAICPMGESHTAPHEVHRRHPHLALPAAPGDPRLPVLRLGVPLLLAADRAAHVRRAGAPRLRRHPRRQPAGHLLGDGAAVQGRSACATSSTTTTSARSSTWRASASDREGDLPHRALRGLEWAQFRTADLVISTNESYRQMAIARGGHEPRARVRRAQRAEPRALRDRPHRRPGAQARPALPGRLPRA